MQIHASGTQRNIALALAAAILGAACGGGGGGDAAGTGNNNGGGAGTVNNPPAISGEPPNSVSAGSTFDFIPAASDDDGDILTFSIENAPAWAVFDTATGQLTGQPFPGDLGEYVDIKISVSDGTATVELAPFNVTVTPQQLNVASFATEGERTETENGFRSVGKLVLDTGERIQEFQNSDIQVTFDEDGNLLDIVGETDLPVDLSEYISVNPGIRAVLGSFSGEEINANPDFGIQLMDELRYMVFYVESAFSMSITNPTDPTDVVVEDISLPVGGKIVIIVDSTDPMVYRYGETPTPNGGKTLALGRGDSLNALLPFRPDNDFPGLDPFNGNKLLKGKMQLSLFPDGVGRTATIEGMRVVRNANFRAIDWGDPLNSPIQFTAGINGNANFGLTVPIVGDFNFADTSLSASYDVGLQRQHLALALHIDVDPNIESSFVPNWFHVLPRGEFNGEGSVNGTGEFSLEIYGDFQSTLPEANIAGAMKIVNDGVTVSAMSVEDGESLSVELEFMNDTTIGRIAFPESYTESIVDDVSAAFDRELAAVEQALQELQEAAADYEFEASLRGLREALPVMMDEAIDIMNGIPDTVYDRAYDKAISVMASYCTTVLTKKVCLDDVVDEVAIAKDIARKAKAEAASGITTGINAMNNLKTRAQQADDEQLREGLRQALDTVYQNRTFSKTITITKTFSVIPFDGKKVTLYNETFKKTVLTSAEADQIAFARDNVWRIQATSDIMIQAQDIVDLLPTEEIISGIKQGVQDGTQQVPLPEGLGYRAIGDTYDALVTIDGEDHVIDINVLKPSEVRTGVSDMLADILLDLVN